MTCLDVRRRAALGRRLAVCCSTALLSALTLATPARAEPAILTTSGGALRCATVTFCDGGCTTGDCLDVMRGERFCGEPTDSFCCNTIDDCPTLASGAHPAACSAVPGLSISVCVYQCLGLAVDACFTPPEGGSTALWDEGDCDGDTVPNAMDPCPCDDNATPTGCPEPDGGTPAEPADAGPAPADAGSDAGPDDAGTNGQDGGHAGADASPRGDPGSTYRGMGGCVCRAGGARTPTTGAWLATLGVAFAAFARRRRRARARRVSSRSTER